MKSLPAKTGRRDIIQSYNSLSSAGVCLLMPPIAFATPAPAVFGMVIMSTKITLVKLSYIWIFVNSIFKNGHAASQKLKSEVPIKGNSALITRTTHSNENSKFSLRS